MINITKKEGIIILSRNIHFATNIGFFLLLSVYGVVLTEIIRSSFLLYEKVSGPDDFEFKKYV